MNRILVFLLFLFFFGCSEVNRSVYTPSEKQKMIDEIRGKVARRIMIKTGLKLCGSGGQAMDQIKMLALSFDYRGAIEIDKARELLIKSVDMLVDAVNADERVRPYLHKYPFEPKNVEIRIFLRGQDTFEVPPGKLSIVSAIRGVFDYDIDAPNAPFGLATIFTETYAEAKQKMEPTEQTI